MKFFIGIVPPAEIYQTILDIQTRHGDNRLEPHITLRPPVDVQDEKQWAAAIAQVGSQLKPFRIELPQTGHFGSRVLFIRVHSEGLVKLYDQLVSLLYPFEVQKTNKHEEGYHPHLTLGRSWCGFTREDFAAMKQEADVYLKNEIVSFTADFLRIYYKPNAQQGFKTYMDVPLNG